MRWNPEIHDPILIDRHRRGLHDGQIFGQMLEMGHGITRQDVAAARRRLKLPANATKGRPAEAERRFVDKINPLPEAKQWLGSRLTEKEGDYWLDGKRTGLVGVMQIYNRMRIGMGLEQVTTNPNWKVPE